MVDVAIIVIIILIVICFSIYLIHKWHYTQPHSKSFFESDLQYYDFSYQNGPTPGPFICLIAGTHGNEPAGSVALNELVQQWQQNPPKFVGHIRVIPNINTWGLANNVRYKSFLSFLPDADINRNYNENGGTDEISREVVTLTKGADLVIDFHEGWGYHVCQPTSVGSTLTPSDFSPAPEIAQVAVANINASTPNTGSNCIFAVLRGASCDIKTTIACHMQKNQRPYILVETTGQNNIQPLRTRTDQVKMVVASALTYFSSSSSTSS